MAEIETKIEPLNENITTGSLEIEKEDGIQNNGESSKSKSSNLVNPFYDIGMFPLLFLLHVLQVIKIWISNAISIPTSEYNELQDTQTIQKNTEDEIKLIQHDQMILQQDMDRLQERLRRLDERRRKRESINIQQDE